jgi:multidrug efflux pump subunit AcrA (membrane-fusion protein)
MKKGQWLISLMNICIFAAAGVALYELGNRHNVIGAPVAPQEGWQNVQINVPVQIASIVQTTLRDSVTAYGYVEPAPASTTRPAAEAHISVPTPSLVSEVDCTEGEHVQKGQLLFALDSRAADAAVQRAEQLLGQLRVSQNPPPSPSHSGDIPALTQLLAQWQINSAQSALDQAVLQRDLLKFTAPISGIVTAIQIHPGETIIPSQSAVDLVDTDHLVIALSVPGFLTPKIHLGQNVILEPKSDEIEQVSFVDPTIDPRTGMASVDAAISKPGSIPGQFVPAQIVLGEHDCLAVPSESIVRDSLGRAQIALVEPDQRSVEMHVVDTGIRDGDLVEVSSPGLEAGAKIVTTGAYGLVTRAGISVENK